MSTDTKLIIHDILATCNMNPSTEDTLVFYDGAMAFLSTDFRGSRWLFYAFDQDDFARLESFLCFRIFPEEETSSPLHIDNLIAGKVDVHTFMTTHPCPFLASYQNGVLVTVQNVIWKKPLKPNHIEISLDDIPSPGVFI